LFLNPLSRLLIFVYHERIFEPRYSLIAPLPRPTSPARGGCLRRETPPVCGKQQAGLNQRRLSLRPGTRLQPWVFESRHEVAALAISIGNDERLDGSLARFSRRFQLLCGTVGVFALKKARISSPISIFPLFSIGTPLCCRSRPATVA